MTVVTLGHMSADTVGTASKIPEEIRQACRQGAYGAVIAPLRTLAEADDPEASYLLATALESGESSAECVSWYRRSAELGNAQAQAALGRIYVNSDHVPPDPKAGVAWLERALANGYQPAHALADQLAGYYRDGVGVEQDWNRAFELFQLAIREGVWGYSYSFLDVAWSQFWGLGTPRDERKAAETYNAFLELKTCHDQTGAHLALAAFHVLGLGVDQDPAQALSHLESAAFGSAGREFAAFLVGHCYLTGYGVAMDEKRGNEIIDSANARLRQPIDPSHIDPRKVASMCWSNLQHAWRGEPVSQFGMANFSMVHEKNHSGYVQERERNRWLRIAASNGVRMAQLRFGERFLYYKGSSVPRDRAAGLMWVRRAAEQGVGEAMSMLAARLEEEDLDAALRWGKAAAENGVSEAAEMVSRIEAKLAFESGDHERAAALFSKVHPFEPLQWLMAKSSLSEEACLAVARAFETGRLYDGEPFFTVQLDKAFKYYQIATYWGGKTAHEKSLALRPRASRALLKEFTGTIERGRRVECGRAYDKAKWEDIERGLAAYSMDDKWIFFVEGERLFMLRSWTGFLWAVAHFALGESGAQLIHFVVTPEATAPDERLRDEVYWMIEYFLLGNRDAKYPG